VGVGIDGSCEMWDVGSGLEVLRLRGQETAEKGIQTLEKGILTAMARYRYTLSSQ
jgi:hypothetical protein